MSLVAAVDQPGVRFVQMDRQGALMRAGAGARRLFNRAVQVYVNRMMAHGAAALAQGPEVFADELARWRTLRRRVEAVAAANVCVDAIQVAGPHHGLPAPPIASDWFAPVRGQPRGFVFYVHGGSFVFDRSPQLTDLVMRVAAGANARVLAPNYRLAPEHPCPAAVDDVVAAFEWFRELWPDEPVAAMAESAGASILLAALQRLQRRGAEMPDGVVLLSPWLDLSLQSWSVVSATLAGATGTTVSALSMMAHLYLDGRSAADPVASPLYGDFAGFPPMLIHACRNDPLCDDAMRLADQVRDCGGDLTVRLWTEEAHVWEKSPGAKARQSIELSTEFIRRRLA
jgi:acetyl esterase/lipase